MNNFAVTGGEVLPGQKLKAKQSVYPKGVGPEAPAWVAFDRQVRVWYSIASKLKIRDWVS